MPGPTKMMGAVVKRKEDPRLVTGTSAYVSDIGVSGLCHVAFVRSPHPHARVGRIDASAALARPGVRLVLTGRDLVGRCVPLPVEAGGSAEGGGGANPGNVGRKHYALSTDRVRAVGEAVAAVVATSEAVAVDAAGDVQVEWEPLPAVTDVFAALWGLTMRRGATDPVCGMKVDRAKALRLEHEGRTYYFCSEHCMSRFQAEQGRPAVGGPHHAPAHH